MGHTSGRGFPPVFRQYRIACGQAAAICPVKYRQRKIPTARLQVKMPRASPSPQDRGAAYSAENQSAFAQLLCNRILGVLPLAR